MASGKHIIKIIAVIMGVAVLGCLTAIIFAGKLNDILGGTGVSMEYETKLFNTDEVMEINIEIDEDDWNTMLENALSEEYYVCDVEINGTTIHNVGIRPKGNTSLSAIAMDPDTDRYSFKLEFDQFVEGQTCYGLDKLILNNNYADATNMKEAIVYDMYQYLGADASLYNYAKVSINGEYWGVYLALEGVEQSFMLRNFGTQDGELYKPDSMEMGGGNNSSSDKPDFSDMPQMPGGGDFDTSNMTPPDMPEGGFPGGDFDSSNMAPPDMPDGDFDPSKFDFSNMAPPDMGQRPDTSEFTDGERPEKQADSEMPSGGPGGGGPGGGFSFGSGGANLNYTDDELDSYSTIWDGEITSTSDADHKRVIEALKNISEGNDIEEYLDVDNILKYMAVHTFSVNMDSLSGSMAHNYYLYEYDGMLNIFPWDYNLSFGGMSMGSDGSATDMVNDAIDTPFAGTEFFDALLENEEYLEKYHEYLRMLVEEYVEGGRFDEVYNRITSQIDELVADDPTAFYDHDEYLAAIRTLYDVIKLRAESISGQLDGTIPSTDEGQKADSSKLTDASDIDLDIMGKFNMGGGGPGGDNESSDSPRGERRGGRAPQKTSDTEGMTDARNMPDFPGGMSGESNGLNVKTLIIYGGLLAAVIIAVIILLCFKK